MTPTTTWPRMLPLTLTVYDGANTSVTLTNGSTNYTYAVGDMLLINAYTNDKDEVISGDGQYVEIVSAAESFVGAQTKIHSNANYPHRQRHRLSRCCQVLP